MQTFETRVLNEELKKMENEIIFTWKLLDEKRLNGIIRV